MEISKKEKEGGSLLLGKRKETVRSVGEMAAPKERACRQGRKAGIAEGANAEERISKGGPKGGGIDR